MSTLTPFDILRAALLDIRIGALMMQDPVMSADLRRYAAEVERISNQALEAIAPKAAA